MGQCVIGGVRITTASNPQINEDFTKSLISATTSRNVASEIANHINTGKFYTYFAKDAEFVEKAKGSIFNLNRNTFKKYVRMYEEQVLPSVTTFMYSGQTDSKGDFDSFNTKSVALNYTADLIIEAYHKLAFIKGVSNLNSKKSANSIKKYVQQEVLKNLVRRSLNQAAQEHNKKAYETFEDLYEKLDYTKRGIASARINLIKAKESDNVEEINKWVQRYKAINAQYDAVIQDILFNSYNLFKKDIDVIENQNYWALTKQLFSINDKTNIPYYEDWFKQVSYLPKVFDIRKSFKDLYEHDKVNDTKNVDYNVESMMNEDELLSIDASTANWNDSLYNNYMQHYDNRIKLYLSTLYKLENTNKLPNGQYSYDTANKLGVPQTMGAGFIIAQLNAFGNFSSINSFIESVEYIANNIPGCKGLIKLADDMKADREFANLVCSNLAKPLILKNMLIYDGNNFSLVHSNRNAYIGTQLFSRLLSDSSMTLTTDYDDSITYTVQNYKSLLNQIKNPKDFVKSKETIGTFIKNYFKKYFPTINSDIVDSLLDSQDNSLNNAKELLDIINDYNSKIEKVKNSIDKESERVRRINESKKKEIANNLSLENWKNVPLSSKQLVTFNPDAVDYNPLYPSLGKLTNLFANKMIADIELNSGNAENNMSSDITKNSYLTNFTKQLQYIINNPDGTENQKGVELLKEFFTRKGENKATLYNEYSTILFGIPNPLWRKGSQESRYLREGLFIKENGSIRINPNAKDLINIILFNGAKNTNVRQGQMYQNMSGADYFTTILNSYFNPINYNRQYGDGSEKVMEDYCQIPLRIPSDASNQYMIQMKKYSTEGLFNYDTDKTKTFIRNNLIQPYLSLKGVHANFTKKVANNLYDDVKLSLIFKNKAKNFINASQAIKILFDDGIKESINLHGYYQENNGKNIPLLVQDGVNSFIIYLESQEATWKSGKNYKIVGISSIGGTFVEKVDPLLLEKYKEISFTPLDAAIENYFTKHINIANQFAFENNGTSRQYNKNSVIFRGLKHQLFGEFNTFFNAISDLFESVEDSEGNIHYVTKKDTKGLFEYYHYNPKKGIVENGKLTGNVFRFIKLFAFSNYNVENEIENILNLYGENGLFKEYGDGQLEINLNRSDLINKDLTGNIEGIKNSFDDVISKWLDAYAQYTIWESYIYNSVTQKYSQNQIFEAMINQTLAYMEFDDLFEGNSKYYYDPQTFLKRGKEIQAGGSNYMGLVDISDDIGAPIHDINDNEGNPISIEISKYDNTKTFIKAKNFVNGNIVDGNLTARNGFRAVTIHNTNTTFDVAKNIYDTVKKRLIDVEGLTEENAAAIAKNIADGYGYSGAKTKVNDAQSYITLEEFIRRKWADGTLSEYKDLISKILDENYQLTEADYNEINRKIQVQKNFYYDMAFDDKTGVYYPRQIKNAEFVLIPRFIKGSDLEELYNIMIDNDINQINTIETSKAANINTLEFWDNNGDAHVDKFKEALANIPESIQTYYYRYLYKQQDVVDHIENEENKAGIQILKKIQDNILQNPNASEAAKDAVRTIQNNITENVEEDFNSLMKECGWHFNDAGFLVNDNGERDIKFDAFYEKARREASRLGMDSNFLDYVTPDANGRVKMPTFMNSVSNKLESIAQSVFNNFIIRQTLPGFHAVQVTNVGYSRKLKYTVDENGITCEIMVAPWSDEIKQMIAKYGQEETLKQLAAIGADTFIGYRIPTEGKQSVVKMKVVGFLDASQGSTIIVPNEWVAQSGSDFDIDTIYSIVHELSIDKSQQQSKRKIIRKTAEGKDFEDEETITTEVWNLVIKNKGRAKRNNEIVEAFKTILSDPSAFEENLSRSNFDNISDAINKYNPVNKNASVYDVFTEIKFMQNAIAGRKLKAFSVNRDTFNSISNVVHGIIKDSQIKVVYDLTKKDENDKLYYNKNLIEAAYGKQVIISDDGKYATVIHNRIGWSDNNRNVIGKLITPYSSQTTAHILDAIKKGTIFNETDYTFGSFKTLIDLGIDYDTAVSFLAQQAITDLNNEYFKVNSVFNNTYPTVLENVYRKFAQDNNFLYEGSVIGDNTSFKLVMQAISNNTDFVERYKEYWGVNDINEIPALSENKFAKALKDGYSDVHYFGVLQIFNNLKAKTDLIEDIAQCSRPDATGARQTVRATRKMLENIVDYATDKKHADIIGESGNQFLVDLYGLSGSGFEKDGIFTPTDFTINVEHSKYKYLAAMLKYGIKTSVTANKELFLFSNDKFDGLTKFIENRIGKELNEDEFDLLKKYYVSSLYAGLEYINSPIILDENNNIISNPNYGSFGPSFWDTERSRVFGYIEPAKNGDNFKVENFGIFTEENFKKGFSVEQKEELNKYYLLTPLQKVMFLKKTLPYDDNIFNKLYISKISDRRYKDKGYTNNKISINVNNANIEDLYQQFRNAFFNKNLLVRLAAIDLIKYAMLVEGFNYRNGFITKIIPNQVFLGQINDKGLNIIERINNDFATQLENEDVYADRFIRSHSELVRSIKIATPSNKENQITLGNILNRYREKIDVMTTKDGNYVKDTEYSGYIYIPIEQETLDLRNALKLSDNQKAPRYIKINSSTEVNGKQTAVLYKVVPKIAYSKELDKNITVGFGLIPLNLLEENEWSDVSINNNNNQFYNYNFYIRLHPNKPSDLDVVPPIIMINGVIDEAANKPEKYVRRVSQSTNTERIESLVNSDNESAAKNLAVHAKKQIVDWYLKDRYNYSGAGSFGIIQVNGTLSRNVLGFEKSENGVPSKESMQDIIIDDFGTKLTVQITPLSYQTFKEIEKYRNGKIKNVTDYIKAFASRTDIFWGKDDATTGLYRIVPVIKATDEELLEDSDKIEDVAPDGMYSKFGGILDEIRYQTTGIKHIDEVHDISTLILRELKYQKNHGNENIANELGNLSIKGFDPNDSESIEKYRTDIYKIAAKYYRDAADNILKRLEQFSCNVKYYSVDDDLLYSEGLVEDPTKANELYHLVLEAATFGNQIKLINEIQYTGEDDETTKNIERIQRAIKDVRNNPKIHKAFSNIYNIYLAQEYSSNPLMKIGIVAMTDIFSDSDWFAANIGDITHLNHKQIQVVTKLATQEIEKARLVAIDEIADFEEWWNNYEKQLGGKEEMQRVLNKLIDKEGRFIRPFTKQFIEDKIAWQDKMAQAEKHGKTSLEYLKTKHARDKWYLDNVSRQFIKEYYKERYNNEDYILKVNPKLYSEYFTVEQEYFGLSKFATLTTQQRARKKLLAEKMSDLRTDSELDAYLNKRAEINSKYFENVESEDFRNTLEKHKEILEKYRKNNPHMTFWEMYTNPDEEFARFRDSYDWIKYNTVYEFSDEAKKEIYDAFKALKSTEDTKKRPIMQVINKFDKDIRTDISGQIIGTLYSLDDARAIRDIMRRKYNPYGEIDADGNLVTPPYTENRYAYDSDANLIKDVPETPIFKESLFTDYLLDEDERTTEIRKTKRSLYTKINNILKKGIDENGEISAELLVQACSKEELIKLGNLYNDLRIVSKKANQVYEQDNSDEENKDKKPFKYKTNTPALLKQHKFILEQSGEIRAALENIFYEKTKDGTIKYRKKIPIGNKFIYGYIDLAKNNFGEYTKEAKKYIDEEKTNAVKLLDDNIVYETTDYYNQAYEAVKLKGEEYFNEWYDANHVYNPYKHRWEPIAIWTVMRTNPSGSLHAKADYVANRDNMQRLPKEGTINTNYNKAIGATYNSEGNYTNSEYSSLTDIEKEILKKLKDYTLQFAIGTEQKKFINSGFAPRVYEKDTDWVDTLNDVANIFGLGNRRFSEKEWHDIVDFEHDFDIDFNMYKLLKAKGYQNPPTLRKQAIGESDAEYAAYKEDWKKESDAIKKANFELDNNAFSKNWKEVYKRLITEGNVYLAKNRMKDLLYLTLQDLRQREVYSVTTKYNAKGDLIKNRSLSTNQDETFYKEGQLKTADTFENWVRRFLFDEYKKYTFGTKLADRVQTINSSKFMMFNLMSGINNVNVGIVNMAMEATAGDYFSHEGLLRGIANYSRNALGFLNAFMGSEINNETVAILQMFNIEDYDKSQAAFQDFKTNVIEKVNDVAYGFLSSGEHLMRSSAMLAMLESHKLYKDPTSGKYIIGTEKDYLQGLEIQAVVQTLKQLAEDTSDDSSFYRGLNDYFRNVYIPSIRDNKREAMKFDRLQKDIINDFVRSNEFNRGSRLENLSRRKKFVDTYVTVKNGLLEQGKKDFAKFETVKDNIYFDKDQHRERIKADSNLTLDHVAELINKAKSVNKKIHGVYDKLGAAKIERYTLGSLIMQYKKHLYPGFMKHWRRKGYYNELRNTNEYGMFWSFFDWISTDFRYKGSINDAFAEGATSSTEEESQWATLNVGKQLINNALDLGINWQLLPDWQKRNVKRFAGDIGGILFSLAIIMLIYGLMNDDDLKDSKIANEALYLADRLYGESTMYGILLSNGLWTEFSNFKDKPIVAMDYIYDAFKMYGYIKDFATNPDYEPNYVRGTYKGENKMWVTLRRNLPAWRQYSQWKHITSHNNYYKVNENNFAQTLFKNIGLGIKGNYQNNDTNPMYIINR